MPSQIQRNRKPAPALGGRRHTETEMPDVDGRRSGDSFPVTRWCSVQCAGMCLSALLFDAPYLLLPLCCLWHEPGTRGGS